MKGAKILVLLGVLLIGLGLLVACTTEEGVARAKQQQADAEARLAAAQAQGTVNVLEAQTNAHVEKMRVETDITKEMRQFDAAMARQEFSTAMLEIQALQIALRETREIVDPIGEDTRAAAENSWWTLTLMPICLGIVALCLGGLVIYSNSELTRRMTALEGAFNGRDATEEG